jgi:hypothetical protein
MYILSIFHQALPPWPVNELLNSLVLEAKRFPPVFAAWNLSFPLESRNLPPFEMIPATGPRHWQYCTRKFPGKYLSSPNQGVLIREVHPNEVRGLLGRAFLQDAWP